LKRVCACAAVSLMLAFCGTVFGAVSEGQFSVSPMIGGYTYYGSGQHLKTAPMYSLRGGYSFTDNIGVEAGLDYSITKSTLVTDKKVAIFKYGIEGLYHFMPDGNLVPFVAVGFGGYNLSGPSALVSRKEMGFVDYGAGVKYFLYDRLALRADVRHILANASAFEYTLGVTIPFGGVKGETRPVATFASIKAALAKMRQEQAETSQIAIQRTIVEEKPAQDKVSQESPVPPAVVAPEESRTVELSSAERLAQQKEQFAKEVTLSAVIDTRAKMHRELAATPQIEVQERAAEDKSIRKDVSQERPTLPAVVAPEESRTKELSPSEKLAELKEQFAKEESERIAIFKAEWEKKQESRSAAEKAARAQETFDQAKARSELSMMKEWNASSQAAVQTTRQPKTGKKKKSALKKRHKTAAKRKRHTPAAR
jgi:outer membrane protein with beta-barrel domain